MSRVIQCDGCHRILKDSEVKIIAVDATIKDNPDRLHYCGSCARHMDRFVGDLMAFQSGIPASETAYIQSYLDSVRENLRDGGKDGREDGTC